MLRVMFFSVTLPLQLGYTIYTRLNAFYAPSLTLLINHSHLLGGPVRLARSRLNVNDYRSQFAHQVVLPPVLERARARMRLCNYQLTHTDEGRKIRVRDLSRSRSRDFNQTDHVALRFFTNKLVENTPLTFTPRVLARKALARSRLITASLDFYSAPAYPPLVQSS